MINRVRVTFIIPEHEGLKDFVIRKMTLYYG